MVREAKIKEEDQVKPKDQMQEEQPQETTSIYDNKVRKITEK